jgi:hypothetical protein
VPVEVGMDMDMDMEVDMGTDMGTDMEVGTDMVGKLDCFSCTFENYCRLEIDDTIERNALKLSSFSANGGLSHNLVLLFKHYVVK